MKKNRFLIKCFAIILLALFSQKVGVGIYLHNWLHTQHSKRVAETADRNKTINYTCHCMDDFAMPFTEPDTVVVMPAPVELPLYVAYYYDSFSSGYQFFNSLRGPPAVTGSTTFQSV